MNQDKSQNKPTTPSSPKNNEETLEQRADQTLAIALSRLNDPSNRNEDDDDVPMTKGGPGSGCQGPNCGRPRTGVAETSKFTMQTSYPAAFTFNAKNPIRTTVNSDGKPVDKFSIGPDNEFMPTMRGDRHAQAQRGDWQDFDRSTRVIQDPARKVALFRFGSGEQATLTAAIDGNKDAMNLILNKQRNLAENLYGKDKGWKIILASGGTRNHDFNTLPSRLDEPDEIPDNPETFVDTKFIYKT